MCYDAASANRFGLEQSQPLIEIPVKTPLDLKPVLELSGSPAVYLSLLQSQDEGHQTLIRLRSVSDKEESVRLIWNDRKPKMVLITDLSDQNEARETGSEIIVPAMGFLTLNAVWQALSESERNHK